MPGSHASHPLHPRFLAFAARCAPETPAESLWLLIQALYCHPPRAYHTLDHIAACLASLDSVRSHAVAPNELELALYFHDCIYFPTSSDNEVRSADIAALIAPHLNLDPARTKALILATRHTGEQLSGDHALIADIDLAILAAPAPEYSRYAAAIRAEYAHIPTPDYNRGRAAFLTRLLAQPRLFHSPHFSAYESPARANLHRELADLAHSSNRI
jgi:predicted metal-dependent HD superfamily phosphohydrolase